MPIRRISVIWRTRPLPPWGERVSEVYRAEWQTGYNSNDFRKLFTHICKTCVKSGEVTITCFKPDERKAGGAYITVGGNVKKIDVFEHRILLEDGLQIPVGEVLRSAENGSVVWRIPLKDRRRLMLIME